MNRYFTQFTSAHKNSNFKGHKKTFIFMFLLISMNSCFETAEKVEECDPCISPTTYPGYTSVFSEEFNSLSIEEEFTLIEGNGCPWSCGYGNGELQFYQNENILIRDGNLVIVTKKETIGDSQYTSGRISTFNNQSFKFGRIDVRAKLPKGQGIWAGIWLLGDNINEVGWPNAGHLSLAELRGGDMGGRNNTIVGKLIWGEPNKVELSSNFISIEKGIFNDKFHVFSIIWEPTKIKWLLNDQVYFERNIDASMNETFNKPFHLILNVAVGGQFPGNPDNTTIFPQEMVVDYIRVFQNN